MPFAQNLGQKAPKTRYGKFCHGRFWPGKVEIHDFQVFEYTREVYHEDQMIKSKFMISKRCFSIDYTRGVYHRDQMIKSLLCLNGQAFCW